MLGAVPKGVTSIKRKSEVLAIVCLFASIICWGVPTVMLRYLTKAIPDGYTTNLVRYPISTVLYIPLIVLAVKRDRQLPARGRGSGLRRFWVTALVPAVVNIIGQTLFAWSPYFLEAGEMSFLVRVSVVWSILGAFLLFPDERPLARSGRFWAGTALALTGFVLLSAVALKDGHVSRIGIVVVLLCSIFWGLYDITVRYTMRNLHPLVVFGIIGNYTSIGLILMAPLGEPSSVLQLSMSDTLLLIGSAFVGIAAAHGMYYVAIQRLGVAVSALALMLTPFVSLLGSWFYLGEKFSALQWIGGLTLIAGAALAILSRQEMLRTRRGPIDVSPD
jgi:drug/metabolite transporter (DMT)-like permease